MARPKDRVVAAVKQVRRRVSKRLMKAHREGAFDEAVRAFEKEGLDLLHKAVGRPAVERARAKSRRRKHA